MPLSRLTKFLVKLPGIVLYAVVFDLVLLLILAGISAFFLPRNLPARLVRNTIEYFIPRTFLVFREQFRDGARVLGYADRHSAAPGEAFHLMLSTREEGLSVSGHFEVFRIGKGDAKHRELMFRSGTLKIGYAESLGTVSVTGCQWPIAATIRVQPDWESGYYRIDFVESDKSRVEEVAYIVILNPEKDGDIVVLLSTNTYQAYNQWGGFSLYSGLFGSRDTAIMVSFDRPTLSHFQAWEFYYVVWLEEQGYKVDYITNFDLYQDSGWAQQYPLFVVLGHNEYWSKEEYDALEARIFALGKNTLFVGANICYWQVRYSDLNQAAETKAWGRQLVCYKWRRDPVIDRVTEERSRMLTTNLFRSNHRRPESMLIGVMFESDFRDDLPWFQFWKKQRLPRNRAVGSRIHEGFRGTYKPYFPEYLVASNEFPFFEGTGLENGESVGGLVGYEWDNRSPVSEGSRENWKEGISLNRPIPSQDVKVVFRGQVIDMWGAARLAEAVYFESKRGAKVFSAGTIRWPWGLTKPGFVNEKFRKLNQNLVRKFMVETRGR